MCQKSKNIRIPEQLPKREREVLSLGAQGETTVGIAIALHISQKTVEYHRMQLMKRTGLYSWAELTQLAIRIGLIEISV